MARLRMAVIGVGHLGKEHARILAGFPDVDLVGVADVNEEQSHAVAQRCGTQAYGDHWQLLNLVDAATIVVPTTLHHTIAAEFLRRGIPLLVEKPLATTSVEAECLVGLAERHRALLQVGHIERFNPAFEDLVRRPLQAKFVECERMGPFSGRSTDIGVVLDLMIHDLELLLHLVEAPVRSVEALGYTVFRKHEDVAHARLVFANGCVANVMASRASVTPRRRMRVWAPEGYASVDFARRSLTLVQPSEALRRNGLDLADLNRTSLGRLKGDVYGRHLQTLHLDLNQGDQLTNELRHFIECVRTGSAPRVGGAEGRNALVLAERILHSLRGHSWNGQAGGPAGPLHIPEPRGPLFQPNTDAA
jgi:predicted dehydrogenase